MICKPDGIKVSEIRTSSDFRHLLYSGFQILTGIDAVWVADLPEPLDVGILLVAHASDHSVAVHGIHNVRLLLCSLSPAAGLKEEGILERKQESVSVARKVA